MSLKFRELRKQKIQNKTHFANLMNVTFKTITNWEKINGVTPSLETISMIAQVLHVSIYEVYDSFTNKPDFLADPNEFHFNEHKFEESYRTPTSYIELFFKVAHDLKLFGSGIIQYYGHVFNFCSVNYKENKFETYDPIEALMKPYDFMLITDNKLNLIPIGLDDIKSWRISSTEYNNLTFEIIFTSPILSEMKIPFSEGKFDPTYITFFDFKHSVNRFPYAVLHRMDKNEVIAKYIKDLRLGKKMSQQFFAKSLSQYLKKPIDYQTINRWENQQQLPTLFQIQAMSYAFSISAERLLDAYGNGYYATGSIEKGNRSFNVGLNHSFDETNDLFSLMVFIQKYKQTFLTLMGSTPNPLCYLTFCNKETPTELNRYYIHDITLSDDCSQSYLTITFENNAIKRFPLSDFLKIEAYSPHQNFYYEFLGEYSDDNTVIIFKLEFSIFM